MWIKKLTAMKGFSFSELVKIHSLNTCNTRYSKVSQLRTLTLKSCLRDKMVDKSSETKEIKKTEDADKTPSSYVVDEKDRKLVDNLKKGNLFYPYKDPVERTYKIIAKDLSATASKFTEVVTGVNTGETEVEYFPRHTDILIIGGGPIGLMIAFQIRKRFPFGSRVIVVDRDPNSPHLSTNLGQGTLIQQNFIDEEEIQMSQYCAEFLSSFSRLTEIDGHPQFQVSYEPMGGLLLADETNAEDILRKSKIMKGYEVHHTLLDHDRLREKFPWLNLDGVLFGSLGLANEGLFDPWTFLTALKIKAYNLGVVFVTADVVDFTVENSLPKRVVCRLPDGSYNSIDFALCVLACGMDTLHITEMLNNTDLSPLKLRLPIEKRKRYEYCFYHPDGPGMNTPIVIGSDGTYFRREGLNGHYVAGVPCVKEGENDQIFNIFEQKVKPFLMKRVKNFEKLEIINGWEDSYEINTANKVGILGPHPGDSKIIYASGFTHHGLQYLPAVGRAAMEYLYYDDYQTIDFTPYHVENLYRKQHLQQEQERKERLIAQQRVLLKD